MEENKQIWYYTKLQDYNARKYTNIFTSNMICGDEIAIKNSATDEMEYFFPLKKERTNYLLPSEWIDRLPLKVNKLEKISWRGKAYEIITDVVCVGIAPKKTLTYKEFINLWLPFEHLSKEEFTLWKIIADTAYRQRINIRAISYPGWLKDSPLTVLSLMRGDVETVNKPTFAKLKWLLSAHNKILGINEVQNLKSEDIHSMSKYYEDVGDFKPKFIGDSRASSGTQETVDISNHSSMSFYNFPKNEEKLFEDTVAPKILSRVFPLLLSGGTHEVTACKETFPHINPGISDEEFELLNEFVSNHKYYEINWLQELESVPEKANWKPKHSFANNRWQKNYETICQSLMLYSDTEEEFYKLEELLYSMNKNYLDYIRDREPVFESTQNLIVKEIEL